MKKTVVAIALFSFGLFGLNAQTNTFKGSIISESEVPESILSAQEENFSGKKIVRWKKQESTGRRGNSFTRYVVVMKEGKRPLSNARYTPDGSLLYYAEYYGPKNIPAFLLPDIESRFSEFRITGGTHIKLYKTQKEYYRVRLKNTNVTSYAFYDKQGNPIDRKDLPKEAEF